MRLVAREKETWLSSPAFGDTADILIATVLLSQKVNAKTVVQVDPVGRLSPQGR
jgi:hypothetical protein